MPGCSLPLAQPAIGDRHLEAPTERLAFAEGHRLGRLERRLRRERTELAVTTTPHKLCTGCRNGRGLEVGMIPRPSRYCATSTPSTLPVTRTGRVPHMP